MPWTKQLLTTALRTAKTQARLKRKRSGTTTRTKPLRARSSTRRRWATRAKRYRAGTSPRRWAGSRDGVKGWAGKQLNNVKEGVTDAWDGSRRARARRGTGQARGGTPVGWRKEPGIGLVWRGQKAGQQRRQRQRKGAKPAPKNPKSPKKKASSSASSTNPHPTPSPLTPYPPASLRTPSKSLGHTLQLTPHTLQVTPYTLPDHPAPLPHHLLTLPHHS